MAKVYRDESTPDAPDWVFFCEGCEQYHGVWTSKPNIVGGKENIWTFNGDLNNPTFSPSIHITQQRTGTNTSETICHSFVKNGQIQFLGDCKHKLKNQTLPLPDVD